MNSNLVERVKKALILALSLSSVTAFNNAWADSDKKMEDAKEHWKKAAKETKEATKDTAAAAKDAASEAADKMKVAYENLKKYMSESADKFKERVQTYNWNGVIHDKVTVGATTIKDITFNGRRPAIVVKPGERVDVGLTCQLDTNKVKDHRYHRVLIGFKGMEQPEKTIGEGFGLIDKDSREEFTLTAPREPGAYEIRFQPVAAGGYIPYPGEAKRQWLDCNLNDPDSRTTIGVILVKE